MTCHVTIAGGVVTGEYEQVKAVQTMILECEELRRTVLKLISVGTDLTIYRDGTSHYNEALSKLEQLKQECAHYV